MNRQLRGVLIGFLLTLFVLGGLALLVWQVILPRVREIDILGGLTGNRTVVDFHTHFILDPAVPQLIVDSQRLRDVSPPLVDNGMVYLRMDFLREFDPFLFWDAGAGVFFASTRYEILEFTPGDFRFYVNHRPRQLDTPIRRISGMVYVPADLIHGLYDITVEYLPAYNMVVITTNQPQTTATVAASRADVRYRDLTTSYITTRLEQGEQLVVFPEYQASGGFTRVRTADGLLGYIQLSDLEGVSTAYPTLNRTPLLGDWVRNWQHQPPNWPEGVSINMVWDIVTFVEANPGRMQMPLHPSLTVVSPTWFQINSYGTRLDSLASREYVDWAHENGVLVWPKVFDFSTARARALLTNRSHRQYAINQLLHYAEVLNLDGINIDFEHLTAAEGPYKIQFLRELAVAMQDRDIVLSAAVKVPYSFNTFYRRDLIALTLDFVQVMAYDQHWGPGSGVGPNASLPWVQRGVINMLNGVYPERGMPPEQLIMGLPFYSRKWRVVRSDESYTVRELGLNYARRFFEERGVVWEWDADYGSYFGEVGDIEDSEFIVYRVWLEDERSIRAKMQIVVANGLAGVASWSRGFETPEVWNVIGHYLNLE